MPTSAFNCCIIYNGLSCDDTLYKAGGSSTFICVLTVAVPIYQ